MKKKRILSRVICMLLVLTTLFSISATTIYAVSEADLTATNSGDGSAQNSVGEFEPITIAPDDFTNNSSEDNEPEDYEDVELVGDVIYTNGLGIRLNSDLKSYTIVEYIGSKSSLDIPEEYNGYPITRINDSAFYGNTKLEELTLTENIIFVGERAFDGCDKLGYNIIDGGYYLGTKASEDKAAEDYYYFVAPVDKSLTEFTVHESTKIVGSFAFENCENLKSVTIGNNVISIGYAVLMQCNSLESLTIPFLGENGKNEKNAHLGYIFGARTVGGNISYVPTTLKNLTVNGGERVAFNALYGMDMLESLTLPFLGNHVNDAENAYLSYVFGGENCEEIMIPQSLKIITIYAGYIGEKAFYKNQSITKIKMLSGVISIGDNAFLSCEKLTSIEIPSNITNISSSAFGNHPNLEYNVYDNANYLGNSENPYVLLFKAKNTSITSCEIYNETKFVSRSAFSNCGSLRKITIPEGVISIGDYAFSSCTNLGSITFPSTLTVVGASSFSNCYALKSITIPAGVHTIGADAFYNCMGLEEIDVDIHNTNYCSKDGILYDNPVTQFICVPQNLYGNITLLEGVTVIEKRQFENRPISDIVISKTVTSIDDNAFLSCSRLTNATIPNSIVNIVSSAFSDCSSLVSITVGDNSRLEYINDHAFYNCTSLTDITIPNSVTSIGSYAFYNCSSLVGITFERNSSLENIGACAFSWCTSLTNITIPYTVTNIGYSTFRSCDSLQSVVFEENSKLTNVCTEMFKYCASLTSITIPNSVTSISEDAFYNCTSLTSIEIPNSVTTIGSSAFYNCSSLDSIVVFNGITDIGASAFEGCSSLNGVYISDLAKWCTIRFDGYFSNPLYYAGNLYIEGNLATKLIIPDSVTSISDYAFSQCTSIDSVEFCNNVKNIGNNAFARCTSIKSVTFGANTQIASIGKYAFRDCTSLASITLPVSVTSIDSYAFYNCTALTIFCEVDSKPSGWNSNWNYSNCPVVWGHQNASGLSAYSSSEFENKVTTLGASFPLNEKKSSAFVSAVIEVEPYASQGLEFVSNGDGTCYVKGIGTCTDTVLIIPSFSPNGDQVTSIGSSAFRRCTNLTSIIIPDGIISIGNYAFEGCTNLVEIKFNAIAMSDLSSSSNIFLNAGAGGEGIKVTIGKNVTRVPAYLFYNSKYVRIVEFEEESICEIISHYAFRGCVNLTCIDIPEGITTIGAGVFMGCNSLVSVLIPNSVTSIDTGAFFDCAKLVSVEIPSGVTRIEDSLFYNCSSLVTVEIPEFLTSIGDNAFHSCSSLLSIRIPESVTLIGDRAFYTCSSLASLSFEASFLNGFGSDIFLSAGNALEVIIGKNVTVIPEYLFSNARISNIEFEKGSVCREIGSMAFGNCSTIASIVYHGERNEWRYIKKTTDWNYGVNCEIEFTKTPTGLLYDTNDNMTEFWISGYVGKEKDAKIDISALYSGRPVTKIYANAFSGKINITEITVPATVIEIGHNAFKNCTILHTANLNSSIQKIGFGIFDGCSSLTALTIPFLGETEATEGSDYIGFIFGAYSSNEQGAKLPKALKSVTVLRGERISPDAFANCKDVEYITIPDSTTIIEDYAFADCSSLKSSVGSEYFIIPDSVTTLGRGIFKNCNQIEGIYIGSGITTFEDYAFELPLFGLDKSVSRLESYTVSSGNTSFVSDESGVLYRYMQIGDEKLNVTVMDAPSMANLTGYDLPEHIVEIAPYAFAYNSTLRFIDLGHVRRVAKCAFYEASGLIYAYFDAKTESEDYTEGFKDYIAQLAKESATVIDKYRLEEYNRLYGSMPENIRPPFIPTEEKAIEEQFYSCIGDRAFMGCISLQEINIGAENIIAIGEYAFADCPKLITVNIGKNLEKLGFSAFSATASGDSNLEKIIVSDDNPHFESVNGVLYSENSNGTLTLELFPSALLVYDSKNNTFIHEYVTVFELPVNINVSAIQTYAFLGAKHLKEVVICPTNELVIGDYAFSNSRIERIRIGDNVTSLGLLRGEGEYTVFSDMEYLTAINVDSENDYYSSLDGVLFDKEKTTLIKYPTAKNRINADGEVLDKGATDYDYVIYEMPNTVNVIASMAFKQVDGLRQVLISSNISAIGLEAFYGCSDLELIYFDDVYAPRAVMENAFTTYIEIEDGLLGNPRTQIGYSEEYYYNGDDGEYGWVNYADTYNLAVYDRLPELQRGNAGDGYYAVVVVDTEGNRLGQIQVSLTDHNGKTETITTWAGDEGKGVATFYDLFDVEGLGFSLDFSTPYALTVTDPNPEGYSGYINPQIYLDEDMRITYITLTKKPNAFGVSCGETEINTETANINKAQFDYLCVESGTHSHEEDGLVCDNGTIRERMEICVIAYCHGGYSFFDDKGQWKDENGLYQNGHKICAPSRAERYDGYTLFYFEPLIYELAEEVDVEVRLTATAEGKENMSCKTVLNIHVFSFIVNEEDVDIQATDLNVDLGIAGDVFTKLFGNDGMNISLGKNVKFSTTVDGDTVTMELKGSKSKSGSYSSYEKGYNAVSKAHNKNTYFFTYSGTVKDDKDKSHKLKYNIRFARDNETDNYYYYQCRVLEDGKEVDRFYGGVNGLDLSSLLGTKSSKSTRSAVAPKAYLIYKMHYEKAKELKKYKNLENANYAESIISAPVQDEADYNFNLALSGNLVFKYDKDKGLVPVSSKVKGEITVSFDWSTQFMVWVIPVIVEVDIDASGVATINFKFDEQRKIHLDDAMMQLSLDLSAYGGIGCKGFSGGFYGVVGTIFILEIAPSFGVESWEVHADVGAQVNALWWTKRFSFWNGKYYIIPPKSEAVAAALVPEGEALAAAYLVDTYSLARAEELESGFRLFIVGDTLYKLSMADMTGEEGYDEFNYVKLALSKWDGYDWEEEILLDSDNKTNDAAYTIYEDNGKTYILFTQQTKVLTNDDSYAGASDLAMKVVEIGADGRISSAQEIKKRDNYVYLQQYAVIDGVPTIVWAENADNNMLGVSPHNYYSESTDEYHVFETTANSIWISKYDAASDMWSEPTLVKDGLAPITDLAVTADGYISYIVDTNSDLADSSDRIMMRGVVNGDFKSINDTSVGSITSMEIVNGKLMYYYDALENDGVDSWMYLAGQENTQQLPDNTPAEFVPVYNEAGDIAAILFHEAKTWNEGEAKVSGSAIYGMFLENGAWGDKVEISAYAPVADYYITEFDAEYSSQNEILIYVSVINSETDSAVIDSYIYDAEAALNVVEYTVDYANSYVTVTVQNVGASCTSVCLSLKDDEYILLDDSLASGETSTYTITLSDSETLEYSLKFAENESGKDAVEMDTIDLNYSDLQIFGKQMLVGGNNTLLVAIKNTGNLENTGITVIRLGNISEGDIVSSDIQAIIDGMTLEDGEVVYLKSEKIWIIKDTVNSGKIKYYEISWDENSDLSDKGLISMAILPSESELEKGGASANNYGYVSYSDLIGVLEDGEELDINPELIESTVAADKTKDEDIVLNYTAGENETVTDVRIDSVSLIDFELNEGTISGVITIHSEDIKLLESGEHTIEVEFSDGTVCTVKLSIATYYTVIWMDGDREFDSTSVIEGTVPSLGYKPAKEADAKYEYVFVGWATVENAENAEIVQAAGSDAVYYAVWRQVEREYTVTWVLTQENGDSVEVSETYTYDEIPSYRGTLFAPSDKIFIGWDKEIVAVETDVTYTAIYKTPYVLGDVNADGTINTRDLAMLRQYVVGKITLTEEQILRCNVYEDYNSDGFVKINTRDVAILQQYIVGSIDTLG